MENTLSITTFRVDDAILLLNIFLKVDLPKVLDQHLRRHGNQKGLSWGWVTTLWLTHILARGDHRKLTVRAWIANCQSVLSKAVGFDIQEIDFTDDKLTLLLKHFSEVDTWHKIEESLCDAILLAYDLKPQIVRVDATTVSGYHTGGENSLFQFGKSKEHPELLNVKIMQTTLDPLGLPLSTAVVPGNRADDRLYVPAIQRVLCCLNRNGLLFVGDSKMSSQETRAFLQRQKQRYLTPLANVGETAKQLTGWVKKAVDQPEILQEILLKKEQEEGAESCRGYSFERDCLDTRQDTPLHWKEQVFVVYSPNYAASLCRGLDQRLQSAKEKLLALSLSEKRKKNKTEEDLRKTAESLLKQYRVTGILTYRLERIVRTSVKYVGRGRGGPDRPQQTIESVRYDLTEVDLDEEALQTQRSLLGWRAFVSNAPVSEFSLTNAVEIYRDQHSIEHGFHRLKGVPLSLNPLFVHRDDQVTGLIHLLSLAIRFLTLIEHRVRTKLIEQDAALVGLHLENPKKENRTPTSERLLDQFKEITLTIVRMGVTEMEHIPPHTDLQTRILDLLDLPPNTYYRLANNSG